MRVKILAAERMKPNKLTFLLLSSYQIASCKEHTFGEKLVLSFAI